MIKNNTTIEENLNSHHPHHHEHNGGFFGVILIVLGFLFLLKNFGLLSEDVLSNLWRYWPILLIALGIQTLLGRSRIGSILANLINLILLITVICLIIAAANPQFHLFLQTQLPWIPSNSYQFFNPY